MFLCRLKTINGCLVLAALVSLVCLLPMGTHVTESEASSAEPASDSNKECRSRLDRLAALRAAETFAYQMGLIPMKLKGHASLGKTGTWHVFFDIDPFVDQHGCISSHSFHANLDVYISPDGRCYTHRDDVWHAPTEGPGEETAIPATLLNEAGAVLVARSYAMRQGSLPTDTGIEQVRTEDGGWLVGFTPGTIQCALDQPLRSLSPLVHVLVYVQPNGACKLMPEESWGQLRPAFFEDLFSPLGR
ncbi:MAG: hypothetical protein JSV19_05540 [Phycisphaerales bacterium]|nr:MAG: hypothetical protein JSV19_05540 [Phycisphaerales bacterium]